MSDLTNAANAASEAGTGDAVAQIMASMAPLAQLESTIKPFARAADLRGALAANPFLMAPMAGVSDAAYRLLARAGGAALAYSEMVSVAGLHYGGDKTWELALPHTDEPDLAVQLFGSKPEQFREAVCAVQERLGDKLVLIDINMACPVPKVTKKGEGSALLSDPLRAAEIVRACMSEATVPVTCKIRRGRLSQEPEVAPEFARAMQEAGVAAIAIHGRFASQFYRGEADWGAVSRVVDAVDIPVIASGDVLSAEAAVKVFRETGAAGVMIARGSYGNPWIFSAARAKLDGKDAAIPDAYARLQAFLLHVKLLEATGAHLARARSSAGWFLRGLPHASFWRERAMHCSDVDAYFALVDDIMHDLEAAREMQEK
ncbi:MAG: tRNA dihydrouridine synthase [Atopobiaceae bacterium]|jgi:tRNA-dihydrouridine synthase B